jgi:hypothetical protein
MTMDFEPLNLPYAPQREKPVSLKYHLDYFTLLYWVFYFSQAIRWYFAKFGSPHLETNRKEAFQKDPIQRNLAIQGLTITITISF